MDCHAEIKEFCTILNENGIQYCVVEWREKVNTLEVLIHPESNQVFINLLLKQGYKKIKSSTEEYAFIYRLIPDAFWKATNEFIIHSACQMSCISLSNLSKCMLPLDNCIQESIWINKYWDQNSEYWKISEEDYLIFLLSQSVFNLKEFDNETISRIISCKVNYDSKFFKYKLESVFFKFAPRLIGYLKENAYENIIRAHRIFCDY